MKEIIVGIVLFLLIFAAWVVIKTLIVYVLWGWVMVPNLGLPRIGFWQCFGLSALVSVLTYQSPDKK